MLIYACPTWKHATDAQVLKLEYSTLSEILTGAHRPSVARMRLSKSLYVYVYITKLCRTQAEVILNNVNPNILGIGQGEDRQREVHEAYTWRRSGLRPFS
jgi:hypothetical protein